jgi:uncharacterized protein (DUF1778 family)
MRGGKRNGAGRPTGSTKEVTKETQVSFRCEPEFKKRILQAAKLAGFKSYQKFLRIVVEKVLQAGEQSLAHDQKDGDKN